MTSPTASSESTMLLCSKCGQTNRVANARLGDGPKCGSCRQSLSTDGVPADLSDQALQRAVKSSPKPVLVDFWAPWCGPCRAFAPQLESFAKANRGEILVAKINTDEHQAVASQLEVRGIPTVALFADGELKAIQSGAMSRPQLERWIAQSLGE